MKIPLDVLHSIGVISVIRAPSAAAAIGAADALVEGGIRGIEITYSTPDVPRVLEALRGRYGSDVAVGAGTVTTADQARLAADSGAEFLVAPGYSAAVAEAMIGTGLTTMIGALTPTEVMLAAESGADVVKIFPASLGGPRYLGALRGPFPDVPLMPTGGVSVANLHDWFAAGALAVGVGGELVSNADFAADSFAGVTRRAVEFAAALRASRESVSA
ncbi:MULTISPECIES: bifunctional 4-hydroxy-2-oxoglutarate aldolase/2-dehydro-3-deoxy-phosphogluconate aldolase [unclassified Microbacterium]|uniref:bifunctional 4-hydroxy-2-oxoglutarate aldolase/2-dehydro-3-deoxy-phosphogluconate aldolase n=1 Tax=unclassified Microbacterium TaxID=2609290 RepID=UPI00214B7FEA|nr:MULTISPECIES: bifunctional 4-hydroxy-2-oxoglutarate aldolase/2-dehydro-3-deoxy-phosphogluconate aldolase [unclassified Microbacterium]MCR2808386.1 bifunctional 4-hydroxy-2-oxoglutarate aldolase/2-dehydro-3-deoxy-phosphogluconate aldolase [Microbacterium sp. zg.B185]WIM19168.1 bifunctional 4-hydroxy-2-oxoglutarate aldolase/2-dehydro-3-deoxy-phosphogluconate aldolase [Microbacterium sp. zg-B185]